jgi:hypothetical protein
MLSGRHIAVRPKIANGYKLFRKHDAMLGVTGMECAKYMKVVDWMNYEENDTETVEAMQPLRKRWHQR